jgi:hypothetical protein
MNGAANKTAANTKIMKLFSSTLSSRYGVGVLSAPVCAILWTAEAIAAEADVPTAKKALKAVNGFRANRGIIPAYFPYGHPLF